MKVLIINGSPRMGRSNSRRLTAAFVKGMQEKMDMEIEELVLSKMNIKQCLGCLNCWKKTPGKCIQSDDMDEAIVKYVEADLIIWSFPLYHYSVPCQLKSFLDRTTPLNKPVMKDRYDGRGNGTHAKRVDLSHQRNVLISTCGFFSYKGNYDSVTAMFDLMLGVGNYTTLFCGEGEMMPVPTVQERVEEYLLGAVQAGRDYADYGTILPATRAKLDELILPKEEFQEMGNSYYAYCERKARERAEAAAAEAAEK